MSSSFCASSHAAPIETACCVGQHKTDGHAHCARHGHLFNFFFFKCLCLVNFFVFLPSSPSPQFKSQRKQKKKKTVFNMMFTGSHAAKKRSSSSTSHKQRQFLSQERQHPAAIAERSVDRTRLSCQEVSPPSVLFYF